MIKITSYGNSNVCRLTDACSMSYVYFRCIENIANIKKKTKEREKEKRVINENST